MDFQVAATEGSAAFRYYAKMTFWFSGFFQIRNFRASRFLPKKELMGFLVSSKEGTYGIPVSAKERTRELSGLKQKKELAGFLIPVKEGNTWLSGFYLRRNFLAFLFQSAGQPVVIRQCSPAPRPEKN
jgi:hypothetical protein